MWRHWKSSCVTGRIEKWHSCRREQMAVPQKIKIELPYDPAIPLLGPYPKELKTATQQDVCTPTFIEAWFTIAKRWNQPKCPWTADWINTMWCIHTVEYYSAFKRRRKCFFIPTPIRYDTAGPQVQDLKTTHFPPTLANSLILDMSYQWKHCKMH